MESIASNCFFFRRRNQFLLLLWILITANTKDSIRLIVYRFVCYYKSRGFSFWYDESITHLVEIVFFVQIFIFIVQMSRLIITNKMMAQTIHVKNNSFWMNKTSNTFKNLNAFFGRQKKRELWPISISLLRISDMPSFYRLWLS